MLKSLKDLSMSLLGLSLNDFASSKLVPLRSEGGPASRFKAQACPCLRLKGSYRHAAVCLGPSETSSRDVLRCSEPVSRPRKSRVADRSPGRQHWLEQSMGSVAEVVLFTTLCKLIA